MAISSNTLFHFTKDLETIKHILNDGYFWPVYCVEYDKGLDRSGEYDAIPMVCFCDIPLSQISDHMADYGKFGIGINKQWGKKKIFPVCYYNDKEAIIRSLYDRITPDLKYRDRILWLSLLKRYYGGTWSMSKKAYYKKVLYNEREWRYIPRKAKDSDLCRKVKDIDSFKAKEESEVLRKFGLNFEMSNIKYIFVENDDSKIELTDYINDNQSFSIDDKKLLSNCILTAKQIKEDF